MTRRTVYVVFRPAPAARWWQRLLHAQRRHVVALWEDHGVTLALDHRGSVLHIEHVRSMTPEETARGLMAAWPGAEAMQVQVETPAAAPCLRPPLTCVEAVKALLGIRSWRIWTPHQLRRALIRQGAAAVPMYGSGAIVERRAPWDLAVAAA